MATPSNKPVQAMPEETRLEAFKRIAPSPLFGRIFALTSVLFLIFTSVFWASQAAHVHQGNADQLVNAYMFEDHATLKAALFPSQHTYLLKWPLFFLVHLFGHTESAYQNVTILTVLLTVLLFAVILHRIERRHLVYGTLIFALASVLLLVPAQPYPGGLLPVNMGMIANRNLEYVLYIASVYIIIRARRIKSWYFAGGVLGLSILMTTDKLFMTLSVGGALIASVVYGLTRRWSLVTVALRWFMASLMSIVGMVVLIGIIGASHFTHVSGQSSGPYGIISSPHQLVLGASYAVTGLLTNFGANPAFDTTYFRQMPGRTVHNLVNLSGPGLIINLIIFVAALLIGVRILLLSIGRAKMKDYQLDNKYLLSLVLLWTAAASIGAFIFSSHYYAGDSRYLTMSVFSLFIALATYVRGKRYLDYRVALTGIIIAGAAIIALPSVRTNSNAAIKVNADIDGRNSLIAQAIDSHPVNVLVGDYWRVLPIRQISDSSIKVMPLAKCTEARDILSSQAWQPDLDKNSFAYVLSLDRSRTDYPSCTLDEVVAAYGKPNASVVIDGSLDKPNEMVLFYDHGAHKSAPANSPAATSAVTTPVPIEELPNTVCSNSTKMNIVAHEDDDLLFMNPDIEADIKANFCVRTVYITAGDAGSNQFYWLGREQGSEAAYAKMIGSDTIWIQRVVKLADNRFITVANPKGNSKISLVFLRLPDGNLHGEGFGASHNQSLQKLFEGVIPAIDSVYGQSKFNRADLITDLATLMHVYQPAEIRTQATLANGQFPDHSDHMATSRFAELAHAKYQEDQFNNSVQIPFKRYIGYPVHSMPENVHGTELDDKTSIFLEYGKHDGGVCHSASECTPNTAYGSYLRRNYTQ